MGAKFVINPQQLGCLIFRQRVCSRLGGWWLMWASAINLLLMGFFEALERSLERTLATSLKL